MKFKEQYEQYVKSVHGGVWSHLLLSYTQWLENLVSDSVVTVEVRGGNVCETTRSKPHIWVEVKDYDNKGLNDDYSETIYTGW